MFLGDFTKYHQFWGYFGSEVDILLKSYFSTLREIDYRSYSGCALTCQKPVKSVFRPDQPDWAVLKSEKDVF